MAAALKLFTQQQLEAAISVEALRQCLDDDNDGEADTAPINLIQEDAATEVLARLSGIFPTLPALAAEWQADLTLVPLRLRRLAIDCAVVDLAKRHPEYVRRDYEKLQRHVDAKFARLRVEGVDSLGLGASPPEQPVGPAANHGGEVWAGGDDTLVENEPFFNGPCGLGDFSR